MNLSAKIRVPPFMRKEDNDFLLITNLNRCFCGKSIGVFVVIGSAFLLCGAHKGIVVPEGEQGLLLGVKRVTKCDFVIFLPWRLS